MDRPLGFGLWESRRISLQKKKNTQATICALELHTRRKQKLHGGVKKCHFGNYFFIWSLAMLEGKTRTSLFFYDSILEKMQCDVILFKFYQDSIS